MKKLLFIWLFLFTVSFSVAQQWKNTPVKNKTTIKTITEVKVTPNPFYENTTIIFNSTKRQPVIFSVKNLLGKIVYSERIEAQIGENKIPFRRNSIQKGMYLYSLQTSYEAVVKRLVVR